MSTKYRMVRLPIDDYPWPPNELPEMTKGDTVFLIRVRTDHGEWTTAAFTPGTTNQSHEEREHGWLGCTNDVDEYAIGRGVVVNVVGAVTDTYDNARGRKIPPYISLKVRLDPSAPDTFEVRGVPALNQYGEQISTDYRPARIDGSPAVKVEELATTEPMMRPAEHFNCAHDGPEL